MNKRRNFNIELLLTSNHLNFFSGGCLLLKRTKGEETMKTTKTLLSIAVIAALPFAANATDPVVAVGPAHASSNPVVATANAPYVTVTPTQADESHIATTAYVKGAYNDAIAAVNNVANTVDGKQAQLVNGYGNEIYSNVLDGGTGIGANLVSATDEEVGYMFEDIARQMTNGESGDPDDILMTAGATMTIISEAGQELKSDLADKQDKLVAVSGSGNNKTTTPINAELVPTGELPSIMRAQETNSGLPQIVAGGEFANKLILADDVITAIGILRVPLYTAWDTNTTTKVSLAVAANAQE